jgi:hypothetical protein
MQYVLFVLLQLGPLVCCVRCEASVGCRGACVSLHLPPESVLARFSCGSLHIRQPVAFREHMCAGCVFESGTVQRSPPRVQLLTLPGLTGHSKAL